MFRLVCVFESLFILKMNDNRLTRQTYKNILGGAVDASIRNALGDIGNRIGLGNAQQSSLLNNKNNLFPLPSAAKNEDFLKKVTQTKTQTATVTTTTCKTTSGTTTTSVQQLTSSSSLTTTNQNNTSCVMLDESENKEASSDVELEEEESIDELEVEEEYEIVDIDEPDVDNPQLVAEYVKDIYKYLQIMERKFRISPTFLESKIVTAKMRSVLIDWLIQVHLKFHLLQETLYLCVQIIDAYLQVQDVTKMQLQLVGVTAMFLASKYEEMYVPAIEDFVYMTDNTYTKSEIRLMEISILKALNFMFGKPLPLHFLRRFSKAGCADPKQHTLAKYFMEMSLHDAEFSSMDPSYLAACALCLSFKLLDGSPWNKTMEYYSTYKLAALRPGMQKLAKLSLKSMELDYKYRAATNKYGAAKFMRISLIPEISGPLMKEVANGL